MDEAEWNQYGGYWQQLELRIPENTALVCLHYLNEEEAETWNDNGTFLLYFLQFEESFLEKKEDLIKLQKDGSLPFQQVPMVEIDGMKLVQTRAIANYISTKYNLYGKDLKERALIDMYVEGMFDLNELFMMYVAQPADKKEQYFANMMDKATNRYFPVFEKVLKDHGKDFLVGNQLSRADVQLLEIILIAEEFKPDVLAKFPLLQSFKARISNIPTIKKFLQPGSQRKPPLREEELPNVMKIFY